MNHRHLRRLGSFTLPFRCGAGLLPSSSTLRQCVAVWMMGFLLLSPMAWAQTNVLAADMHKHLLSIYPQTAAIQAEDRLSLTEGVLAFYALRQYRPAWEDPAHLQSLIAALKKLSLDGLNPADYQLQALEKMAKARLDASQSQAQSFDLDLLATQSCLLALLHIEQGKLDPRKLHPRWNFAPREYDRDSLLQKVSSAIDRGAIDDLFHNARPRNPIYANLLSSLQALRVVDAQGGWPQLATGPKLQLGQSDPQVVLLRKRLLLGGYLSESAASSELYDADLAEAVKQFQQEQYLNDDGVMGNTTRLALNVPVSARIDQLRVNLERARWWLPRINGDFVMVDVAGYKVRFMRAGKSVWSSRVQVGTAARRTPIFKSDITNIVFNPPWTIPPTILRHDVLPKIRKNANYLKRNRIRIFNAQGQELAASQVDWNKPGSVVLRQDPGPASALGQVKINFPNPHSVYLHQTPHAELFAAGARPFSSGCIRVEYPFELAEILLNDPLKWNRAAINRVLAGGKTTTVTLPTSVPILMLYWTVDIHPSGRIGYKPDIYSLDRSTLVALDSAPTAIQIKLLDP